MKVAIIGGGVMGELIGRSLLDRQIIFRDELVFAEIIPERREWLEQELRVSVLGNAGEAAEEADLVVLCVKPQGAAEALESVNGHVTGRALVISIMAGVTLSTIQEGLKHRHVVRAMPNLPARIGTAMTVWMADEDVPDLKLLLAKVVFQSFGLELRVDTDELLDAATAVSGTGPAYIFYVAELLIAASNSLGFTPEQSHAMVRQTFRGAMDMWARTLEDPEKLRLMVTSKGGTTEAAVERFQAQQAGEVFDDAVKAAFHRARELGRQVSGKDQ